MLSAAFCVACAESSPRGEDGSAADLATVRAEVEAAVLAFHAADTARDAEAVVRLLWPDMSMLVDGVRQEYGQIATSSHEFMGGLEHFHTEWTDLRITPLGQHVAVASFLFRDSIVTQAGDLIRSRGPTTFVWERRNGEWRIRFADADHYPVER